MTVDGSLRCAVYTRKSSEEGLDQAFNSLHAQREAGEAYVKSQASEGWRLLKERYDDGGFSGGVMDRPGLRKLLGDVGAKKVDVVVVYKVDRLTRYLPDFAKIIEAFDRAGVSFVSVTQPFNTTSSMGRLTLNVLLSFAQFEREVTGERIRDKIAASKAKGMWMGGLPPLGYDPPASQVTRALVVNVPEAEKVKLIFRRYLELGNVYLLQQALKEEGIRSKGWISSRNRKTGGCAFSRGALLHLLKNRTYLGEIIHKGQPYPGRHPAILDRQTFEAAQAILAANSRTRREHVPRAAGALLNGLLFAADGQRMEPLFYAARRGKTYRYYASGPSLLIGSDPAQDDAIRRVPADAADGLVGSRVATLVGACQGALDRSELREVVARVEIHAAAVHLVLRLGALGELLGQRLGLERLRQLLTPGEQVTGEPGDHRLVRILLPVRLKVRGGRTWGLSPDGEPVRASAPPNYKMIRRLRAAHATLNSHGAGPDGSASQLLYARAPRGGKALRKAQWAFLAPDVQRAILEGRPIAPDAMKRMGEQLPLLWSEQRAIFGLSAQPGPP